MLGLSGRWSSLLVGREKLLVGRGGLEVVMGGGISLFLGRRGGGCEKGGFGGYRVVHEQK